MLYLIYSAANELVTFYLFRIARVPAYFIYDLFTAVEFCFFSWFFYLVIHSTKIKKLILPVAILFLLFSLCIYLFTPKSTSFSSVAAGVESILIIAMCIYYFFDQLKQPDNPAIYSSFNFWVIISFLIFLSGTFFLNIYADSMHQDKSFLKQYYLINFSFTLLKNILFSIAMLMKPDVSDEQPVFPDDKLDADFTGNNSF